MLKLFQVKARPCVVCVCVPVFLCELPPVGSLGEGDALAVLRTLVVARTGQGLILHGESEARGLGERAQADQGACKMHEILV